MTSPLDGLLLVDKPSGPTSHDVVSRARKVSGQRRIGHAGTLDPSASGLLPLLFGRATRLLRYLPTSPKVYEGSFRLGLTTKTDDIDGDTLTVHSGPLPKEQAVREGAHELEGESLQVPPKVSARKIGGRRMYELARKGIEVEAPATPIEVEDFRISSGQREDTFGFRVAVSGGTYVRGLVRDLGERLGCGATLTELRRTRIAQLRVEDAIQLDPEIPGIRDQVVAAMIPLPRMPLAAPRVLLESPDLTERFLHGQTVAPGGELPEGTVGVYEQSGELLGLAETRGTDVRPTVVIGRPREAGDRR